MKILEQAATTLKVQFGLSDDEMRSLKRFDKLKKTLLLFRIIIPLSAVAVGAFTIFFIHKKNKCSKI